MSLSNSTKFMILSYKHVENINRVLKSIKLNIITDFIWADYWGLIIITNKVILFSDLSTIKKYIKNIDIIESDNIMVPKLSQSKSYFKILNISYLIKNTNIFITSNVVKRIIKFMYIFNNVILASKSRVIKALSKSGIVVF